MKRILGAALVAFALIGSVATATAVEVPDQGAPLQGQLNFWQQFTDSD